MKHVYADKAVKSLQQAIQVTHWNVPDCDAPAGEHNSIHAAVL